MTLKEAIKNTKAEIESRNPKTYQDLRNCVDAYICLTTGYDVLFSQCHPKCFDVVGVQLIIPGRGRKHVLPSPDSFYEVTPPEPEHKTLN